MQYCLKEEGRMHCDPGVCSRMFAAVRNNDETLVRETLTVLERAQCHWYDVSEGNSGDTVLHVAARIGHLNIMRILCEWASVELNLEVSNYHGKKCLHEAAQASHPHVVSYLLKQGAEIDSLKAGDWTPLMLACTKVGPDALETVEILLRSGANTTLTNKDGWTPLHIAAREGDCDIIHLLLSFKSNVTAVTNNGRTVLHIAAFHGRMKAVELLLNIEKAPVHYTDFCGTSPLLEAVRGGSVEIVQQLLKKGASLDQVDSVGLSSIHLAAQMGHSHMIKYLVEDCGVSVNILTHVASLSALHCAARAGQVNALKTLLELGADPCIVDGNKRTVADTAYWIKEEEIRNILKNFR